MFWDSVEIEVKAGRGGDGAVSFRTALGESKGGPDGGDGGEGGSVIVRADRNLNTLADYARQKTYAAIAGEPGRKTKRHGKSAEDLVLPVPVGTQVVEAEVTLVDLVEEGQEARIVRGGRGGFGNAHFTSSTRQTPRMAELGEPGEEKFIRLELKLVADVGLVGLPSVGKSTLLSRFTAATPKIADYPFTTLVPQLGIARIDDATLTIADVPGLIEGAHLGKGLGDAFLRHIERTKVIIHLLDATRLDPAEDYVMIRQELESFSPTLTQKPEVVVLNKIDAADEETGQLLKIDLEKRMGRPLWLISAVSGQGLQELLRHVRQMVAAVVPSEKEEDIPVITLADLAPHSLALTPDGQGFVVAGSTIERLAQQTDFENYQAEARFWWVFRKLGGEKQLEKRGAEPGVRLRVAGKELAWQRA